MHHAEDRQWEKLTVEPERVLERIEAGMSIFLSTGVAEPRTVVKHMMETESANLEDLELIQVISLSDAISLDELTAQKYRLKTFFSGWVASEAITAGRVDLIPSRFSEIPRLIASGQIPIDVAVVQITPPNEAGYCSLGVAVDVARYAMEKASLVVGEINPQVPITFGDTFVPVADFDLLVSATEQPIYFNRWPMHDVFDRIAANVAAEIEDGSCIAFSIGPLFEALSNHLVHKRNLGVHSPFFTDALMDLVRSGAVTNRNKDVFRGKSVTSYGLGTPDLMCWLNRNPLIEFQSIDKVFSPNQIGRNPGFVCILPARKADLSGRISLHVGKGNVAAGPENAVDFVNGAELSRGGRAVFALPSRNLKGEPNIRLSVEEYPNEFSLREAIDMVVTEYGVAYLKGRTVRERAQALIDVAHPYDRPGLVEQAKEKRILYPDQIYLVESAHLYPEEIATKHTFKGGVEVRFRAIKPSDEEEMRRLFYRFSDEAVYYRYFSPIKAMPHAKMQEYVNVDFSQTLPIVGLVSNSGEGHIIAEARFVRERHRPYAEVAFIVDEEYQGLGIATYLLKRLVQLAKKQGIKGFTADVLSTNKGMMKVFEKSGLPIKAKMEYGIYNLTIDFEGSHTGEGPPLAEGD
jgi:acyl-CoA hydrolase/RimJ/RimL family protein N-acetyltransferase